MTSASRPSADLTIPDDALGALFYEFAVPPGESRERDQERVRAVAAPVVAQFLGDLAATHDRVSGDLLGELADQLDGGGSDE